MVPERKTGFIMTLKERCRVCYTCVRECPAKSIRITDGQAEVMPERCISCGNCVRVCSQNAKQVISSIGEINALLAGDAKVAACVAPSFPADFDEYDYQTFVGMIRSLGFDYVTEVGFGADLVAQEYARLLEESPKKRRYISTPCPAVITYVEKYHSELVDSLAPIVSPMVAMARVMRKMYGSEIKIVFMGPCIAKKCEAESLNVAGDVDGVLTFVELREMFNERSLNPQRIVQTEFDAPLANLGALFPIGRGLLQAADIAEDLVAGEVVTTDGNKELVEAIKEFSTGDLDARFLEILCCNGCIMGAGMSSNAPLFTRRSRVSQYVRQRVAHFDEDLWRKQIEEMSDLNLRRGFQANNQRLPMPRTKEITEVMSRMGKLKPEDELNCGACGYDTCVEHAVAILKGLAESEMCLPHTIDQLRTMIKELAHTQEALVQSEKLASMGQLAAGIAHEVNNPLGVVLMYSHLLLEEAENNPQMQDDLKMVVEQADRCKKIVAGLLHFARQNKVTLQPTDIKEIIERNIEVLAVPDNVVVNLAVETDDTMAELDGDQIAQVFTNLLGNAVSAMPDGGELTVKIMGTDDMLTVHVIDTGTGISATILPKIFEPFFTTKEIGMGTGLGLAVTYGIIKMHRGDVKVSSNDKPEAGPTGTTFTITLPRKGQRD